MKTNCVYVLTSLLASFRIAACAGDMVAQQTVAPEFLKPSESRKFSIEYVGIISNVPAGTRLLRVWLPVPTDSTVQKISDLKFSGASDSPKLTTEPKYQNRIAYFEIAQPAAQVTRTMSFICERKEIKTDLAHLKTDGSDTAGSYTVFATRTSSSSSMTKSDPFPPNLPPASKRPSKRPGPFTITFSAK